jgi:hypothetical protein
MTPCKKKDLKDPRRIVSRSPIFDEIVQEGIIRAQRSSIVTVLTERLGAVPRTVVALLNDLEDTTELSRLLRLAARCTSLDEFAASLPVMAAA